MLTVAQAATALGVTVVRVRALLAAGRIPGAAKFGRDWAIPEAGLAAVLVRKNGRPKKVQGNCN